jgi:hypothetical protein
VDATRDNVSRSKICTRQILSGAGVILYLVLASLPYPYGILSI